MHDFVVKEIRNIYSSYDGWKITSHSLENGYDTLVSMERRMGGHRESVKVLVTLSKSIPSPLPEELTRADRAADGTVTRHDYAVMVPANADVSAVPAGVRIYTMKSFAFEGKELVWVKKPVQKSKSEPTKLPA
ncbi:hypothetical protein [Methanoregula sp.]|jgi:hypothetical protein|uniref:hypothetical protein n=1 Tax=Methanoregula sp. TaxID=2052170 RepID=UPI0025F67B15|nr:hypothetical protein [Methanoregula sp.]